MSDHHLAQLNIARAVGDRDDPRMADFYAAIDRTNALADAAPGFVWRMINPDPPAPQVEHPWGDLVIVNLSVWRSVETLTDYAFRSAHLDVMRRRREWFVPFGDVFAVNWWVPAGHVPTVAEAAERLDMLREHGAGPQAFTLRHPFPVPVGA